MIYCGTKGHVFCLNVRDGAEVWRTKLKAPGILNPAASEDVTVLLAGEVLVAAANGHAWGLKASTGEVLWHNGLPGLGNRFITMCTEQVSVQYVHVQTSSPGAGGRGGPPGHPL